MLTVYSKTTEKTTCEVGGGQNTDYLIWTPAEKGK